MLVNMPWLIEVGGCCTSFWALQHAFPGICPGACPTDLFGPTSSQSKRITQLVGRLFQGAFQYGTHVVLYNFPPFSWLPVPLTLSSPRTHCCFVFTRASFEGMLRRCKAPCFITSTHLRTLG
jgi:hypothetical protein